MDDKASVQQREAEERERLRLLAKEEQEKRDKIEAARAAEAARKHVTGCSTTSNWSARRVRC
jgi:hypothetical protein